MKSCEAGKICVSFRSSDNLLDQPGKGLDVSSLKTNGKKRLNCRWSVMPCLKAVAPEPVLDVFPDFSDSVAAVGHNPGDIFA